MKGDRAIESGRTSSTQLSDKAAAKGGVAGKLAGELADDASFLRKLKPSLIVRRAKGELPKDAEPGAAAAPRAGRAVGAAARTARSEGRPEPVRRRRRRVRRSAPCSRS